MRPLYEAANAVEAHMIVDLLKQAGLSGRVDGEYLQGGIGELPAAGMVRVMVDEHDYPDAKHLVERWDAAQPVESVSKPLATVSSGRMRYLAAGMLTGALCAGAFYTIPVRQSGVDGNRDGVQDMKWIMASSGSTMRSEEDRNFDRKPDVVTRYDRHGSAISGEMDENFDGRFETRLAYQDGVVKTTDIDGDGDAFHELRIHHVHGVAVSADYLYPPTGQVEKTEFHALGKVSHAVIDDDKDGRMDRRIRYDAIGETVAVEALR